MSETDEERTTSVREKGEEEKLVRTCSAASWASWALSHCLNSSIVLKLRRVPFKRIRPELEQGGRELVRVSSRSVRQFDAVHLSEIEVLGC